MSIFLPLVKFPENNPLLLPHYRDQNADGFHSHTHSSFFQSVCIIGYTLFPLVIASILSAVGLPMIARIPVYIVLVLWSLAAGISILGGSGVVKNRVALAMFPLVLYYASIVTLCFIS